MAMHVCLSVVGVMLLTGSQLVAQAYCCHKVSLVTLVTPHCKYRHPFLNHFNVST